MQEATPVEGNIIEDVSSRHTLKNNTIINTQSGINLNKARSVRAANNAIAAAKHPTKLDWATSLFSTKSAGAKGAMRKKLAAFGLK